MKTAARIKGLSRFDARAKVVEDLEKLGLLVKIEKHMHAVGHCYRCHTIIEPYLSKQWFVKIKPLAEAGIKAVEDGRIRFVPKNWEKTYFEWMYNIRDWCISRQLWWGHRIPAFYCNDCEHITVQVDDPSECEKCKSKNIRQDEDVLDTWFSSGLWPFSTLGWPEKTPALKKYYPTSVLVTAFDIIFFWVARMIMMGLKFMGDVPFRDVYIHALIRDEQGAKMSKSKGNVIDPLIMMDQYGTDALRFTLAMLAAQGRDIILSEKRIEGYRTFCNKIWNATRFILMNLGDDFRERQPAAEELETFDRWILHRLNEAVRATDAALADYKFNDAAHAIYSFWWHEFCDWYIELTKQRLYDKDARRGEELRYRTAGAVLSAQEVDPAPAPLHALHHRRALGQNQGRGRRPDNGIALAGGRGRNSISRPSRPRRRSSRRSSTASRNVRGEMNVPPDKKAPVVFKTANDAVASIIRREEVHIKALARVESITLDADYTPGNYRRVRGHDGPGDIHTA